MGRAIGVNMYLEMRKAGNQVAGPTRMIKVYMREQDMADVGESHAQLSQAVLEAVERRGRARVYERRLGTVDPIRRDHPRRPRWTTSMGATVIRASWRGGGSAYRFSMGTTSRSALPMKICLGRAILSSGSPMSSSHCANHPTLLGIAKSTGNISTGNCSAS